MAPSAYAFFDLDGTVISEVSLLSFLKHQLEGEYPESAAARFEEARDRFLGMYSRGVPRETVNQAFYEFFLPGKERARIFEAAQNWFNQRILEPGRFNPSVMRIIEWHRKRGDTLVFATGSFPDLVFPIKQHLGFAHILGAPLEIREGRYTGKLTAQPTIGDGKAKAVLRFLEQARVPGSACYAYGDDITDLPMLESVGYPNVVSGSSRELVELARSRGWTIL